MAWKRKKYRLKEDNLGHNVGTVVYEFCGHDYGLARDDTEATGIPHVSVSLKEDGGHPTITAPVHILEELSP